MNSHLRRRDLREYEQEQLAIVVWDLVRDLVYPWKDGIFGESEFVSCRDMANTKPNITWNCKMARIDHLTHRNFPSPSLIQAVSATG
jgi:hypothetical protein